MLNWFIKFVLPSDPQLSPAKVTRLHHSMKQEEWFTTSSSRGSSGGMKIKIKRKPGRPKKKSKTSMCY